MKACITGKMEAMMAFTSMRNEASLEKTRKTRKGRRRRRALREGEVEKAKARMLVETMIKSSTFLKVRASASVNRQRPGRRPTSYIIHCVNICQQTEAWTPTYLIHNTLCEYMASLHRARSSGQLSFRDLETITSHRERRGQTNGR
jgi:hypothetical protein